VHKLFIEITLEVFSMCKVKLTETVGICALCFGAGIILSLLLPPYILIFLEAIALAAAGILLLGKRRR